VASVVALGEEDLFRGEKKVVELRHRLLQSYEGWTLRVAKLIARGVVEGVVSSVVVGGHAGMWCGNRRWVEARESLGETRRIVVDLVEQI
jgi:hypothetical protein